MEDLKKVQEFFSKPMSEELDLSNSEFTDSGLQMYLINLNKELSYYLGKGEAADLRYAEMLKKDIADAKSVKCLYRRDKKNMPCFAKYFESLSPLK